MNTRIQQKQKGLSVRNLIFIGVFATLFLVAKTVGHMLMGTLTSLFPPAYMFVVPGSLVLCGIVYMVVVAKVPVRGAILLLGAIASLVTFVMGTMWPSVLGILLGSLAAELIVAAGGKRDAKRSVLGYIAWGIIMDVGGYVPVIFMRDYFIEYSQQYHMSPEGMESAFQVASGPLFALSLLAAVLCAGIGAFIGYKLLKKHFT
jgi:energy-coupling factor transport system substrate-specific component